MSEARLPDFIAVMREVTRGVGYEVDPGIQFGGGLTKGNVRRGDLTCISLIFQNALDSPVNVKIDVILPEKRMLNKTNFKTIPSSTVSLEGAETEQVTIPIRASMDTPEGEYQAEIQISTSYERRGNRIRGSLKEIKEEQLALGKSVAASVALSAIRLFLGGGIAIAAYSKKDRVILNFKVSGVSETPNLLPLEVSHQKLWRKAYTDLDPKLGAYLVEMAKKYSDDRSTLKYIATNFTDIYRDLFKSVGFPATEEELVWMGELAARLTFEASAFYTINISILLLEKIGEIIEANSALRSKSMEEYLDFRKNILDLWFKHMRDPENIKWFFAEWAAQQVLAIQARRFPNMKPQEFIKRELPGVRSTLINSFEAYKQGKDVQDLLGIGVRTHISWAVVESEHLFDSDEERRERLKSLKSIVGKNYDQTQAKNQRILQDIEARLR